MTPLWKLDIPRDVQIAKWGLGMLLLAFGTAFLYFIGEFKDVRHDLADVKSVTSGQAATMTDMNNTLNRIEDKLDSVYDHPQASDRTGQTQSVHRGKQ